MSMTLKRLRQLLDQSEKEAGTSPDSTVYIDVYECIVIQVNGGTSFVIDPNEEDPNEKDYFMR